jgi:NAD(P)-dependent dehydrogenase (short-subunit alcohol dehydrogenase family)
MKSLELFDLSGKVALVTGGARGLGKQHALALAEAGADVAICDLLEDEGNHTCQEIQDLGRRVYFEKVNVTKTIEIEQFIDHTLATLGKIDILVNNAARPSEGIPLVDVDDALWQEIVDTNLSSLFYFGKRVAKYMIERNQGGSIINIGSINSLVISNIVPRHNVTYCVTKAGVAQLTRGMAADWAPYNIRVNCLAPGYFRTEQTSASARIPEIVERITNNTPMHRYGKLDELKGAIVFLASEASSYMTGSVLVIDGGFTIW